VKKHVPSTNPGVAGGICCRGMEAVLMAGTNDLQEMRCPATPIGTCIQYLHMACHVEGVKTVALSVPPNRFLG